MERRERQFGLRDQIINQFVETDRRLFEARDIIVGHVMGFTPRAYSGVEEIHPSSLTRDRGISYPLGRTEVRNFTPSALQGILVDLGLEDRPLYVQIQASHHSYSWKDGREYSIFLTPSDFNLGDMGIEIYSLRKPFCRIFACQMSAVSYDDNGNEIAPRPMWQEQPDSDLARTYNALCEGMVWPGGAEDASRFVGSAGYHEPHPDPRLGVIHHEIATWVAHTLQSRRRPS